MEEASVFASSGCFPWMPQRADQVLQSCFDLEFETLAPGQRRDTRGRIGCLLHGTGRLDTGEAAGPGFFFGAARTDRLEKVAAEETLEAGTACLVAWFDFDVVLTVCYTACWFHARLIQEMEQALDARRRAQGAPAEQ